MARQREIRMQAQEQKIRMEEQRLAARLVNMDIESYQTIVRGKASANIKALYQYLSNLQFYVRFKLLKRQQGAI